jgi:signal transduction histidine kinase
VDLQAQIQGTVADLERSLLNTTRFDPLPDRDAYLRSEPLARQIFIMDSKGRLVAPNKKDPLSAEEEAFLKRTERIWSGGAILNAARPAEGLAPKKGDRLSQQKVPPQKLAPRSSSDSFALLAKAADHGWVAWYWEEGLHLLFWRKLENGQVVGVEVERIALLGRVVGKLPTDHSMKGRIVLADSKGEPVYQWGGQDGTLSKSALAQLHLQHPLDAWQLQYFPDASEFHAGPVPLLRWNLLVSLLVLGLALLGLAIFVYRESTRTIRDASRRVGFVTQVSHELKTPLTNIRLYGELLEENLPDDEKLEKYTRVIVQESERLSRLIGNVLTFSREKNDLVQLNKKSLQVKELLEPVLAQFQMAFERKEIELHIDVDCPRPVPADADAVGQILENLLSNVEKYAGRGSQVQIRCTQDDRWVRVYVEDDGPGVPASMREKIFEPFFRVSDRLTDGTAGTGIGLSIARDLARLHGGDLVLEATATGAAFALRLPVKSQGD